MLNSRLLHFLINLSHLFLRSELFSLHDKDFQIDLPKENWKVNDYSLAVYGVVMFASKKLNGKLLVPSFNVLKKSGVKLKKAVVTKDVITVC